MATHKGKPSGKYAENKSAPGRKGDYKRSGWPEEAPTQRVADARGRRPSKENEMEEISRAGEGRGRDRKAGSPV
jgi:hypothetical protein